MNIENNPDQFKPGNYDLGNNKGLHVKSDDEFNAELSREMLKMVDMLNDKTMSLAHQSAAARKFLDWHCDHVRLAWMEWKEQSKEVLEDIRQTRVAIEFESRKLLSECADVRKFFLGEEHTNEVAKLREFIELCERLRALKNDGTLDKIADTILKLS